MVDHGDADDPDPLFVAQLRQALRASIDEQARTVLDVGGRQRIRGWTSPVMAACTELLAISIRANLADDPAVVLAQLDAAASLLTDLSERTVQLRAELRPAEVSPRRGTP